MKQNRIQIKSYDITMISVMAGVVVGAGLIGSVCSKNQFQSRCSEHISEEKQLFQNNTRWSMTKNIERENNTNLRPYHFDKNKLEETFTQLYIWKY